MPVAHPCRSGPGHQRPAHLLQGLDRGGVRAGASLTRDRPGAAENPRIGCDLRGIDWRLGRRAGPSRRGAACCRAMPIVAHRGNAPNMRRLLDAGAGGAVVGRRSSSTASVAAGRCVASCAIAGSSAAAAAHRLHRAQSRGHGGAPHRQGRRAACAACSKEIDYLKVRRPGAPAGRGGRPGDVEHAGRLPSVRGGCRGTVRSSSCRPAMAAAGRARTIDDGVPRRAILVGSLDWPPKRVSLEVFPGRRHGDAGQAGIELQIVGEVEAGLSRRLCVGASPRSTSSAGRPMSGPICGRRG